MYKHVQINRYNNFLQYYLGTTFNISYSQQISKKYINNFVLIAQLWLNNFTLNNKFHEVYNIIDRHFLNEWLTNFQQCTTGQQYLKYFHPPYNLINLNFNGNRHKETIFNRLRLQNCKNNYYLFKIGASISPLCDLCLQTDTVEHFLTECFKHSSMHSELKLSCKNIKKPFNVHSVLSNITLYNIIYRYIVKNKLQFKF